MRSACHSLTDLGCTFNRASSVNHFHPLTTFKKLFSLQLFAMDPSARVTMKDAAKCDKRCEWQNSANQQNAERILHFQVTPESMSGSGHLYYSAINYIIYDWLIRVSVCQGGLTLGALNQQLDLTWFYRWVTFHTILVVLQFCSKLLAIIELRFFVHA